MVSSKNIIENSKKEKHAQRKNREIQRKYNKNHNRYQHTTDDGGQALGDESTHVQVRR